MIKDAALIKSTASNNGAASINGTGVGPSVRGTCLIGPDDGPFGVEVASGVVESGI